MRKIVVVETEEDKAHLVAAKVDRWATIFVSGGNSVILTGSFGVSGDTRAVYVVGVQSEEDRFFKQWLTNSESLISRSFDDRRSSILPASPSIEAASQSVAWVDQLKTRLWDESVVNKSVTIERTIFHTIDEVGNVIAVSCGFRVFDSDGGYYADEISDIDYLKAISPEELIKMAHQLGGRAAEIIEDCHASGDPFFVDGCQVYVDNL